MPKFNETINECAVDLSYSELRALRDFLGRHQMGDFNSTEEFEVVLRLFRATEMQIALEQSCD